MRIGVPKEIKDHEFRVSLTPLGARELVKAGHEVYVENHAGSAIGFSDSDYENSGAVLVDAGTAFSSDMVLKVKEPQPNECAMLKPGTILFGYLHLASSPSLARALMDGRIVALGYETVTDKKGGLPLLAPMSQIAGKLAIQEGAIGLTLPKGGNGMLLSGAYGVPPAKVMVLGAGMVGSNAARLAHGMGGDVTVFDVSPDALFQLEHSGIKTCYASADSIEAYLAETAIVVCATLIPGRHAPKIISREMVRRMKRGAVIVDVSIDQGGSSETSRPTTHSAPFYVEEGVVHYCVTNMPALVSRTSTLSLTHATLPYVLEIANLGIDAALQANEGLRGGLQIREGSITHPAVSEALHPGI